MQLLLTEYGSVKMLWQTCTALFSSSSSISFFPKCCLSATVSCPYPFISDCEVFRKSCGKLLGKHNQVPRIKVNSGNRSQKCLYRSFITLHFQVSTVANRTQLMTVATSSMMHLKSTWTRFREESEKRRPHEKGFGEVNACFIPWWTLSRSKINF